VWHKALAHGELSWLAMPSRGLNYNFRVSSNCVVGLHTSLIKESFRM
jgi:hypothetical protein